MPDRRQADEDDEYRRRPLSTGRAHLGDGAGRLAAAAEYIGVQETSAWFGGPPSVLVLYTDTRSGGAVEVDRVIPRETND